MLRVQQREGGDGGKATSLVRCWIKRKEKQKICSSEGGDLPLEVSPEGAPPQQTRPLFREENRVHSLLYNLLESDDLEAVDNGEASLWFACGKEVVGDEISAAVDDELED
nr:hypothetical protein Itr_chr05CG11360 [Ipomoea trifida]